MTRRKGLALLALAACMPLAACGDDDDDGGGSGEAAKPAVVSVVTTETGDGVRMRLSGGASLRPGVTRIDFRNDGKRPHEAQLIRVEGNHSQAEMLQVLERAGEGGPLPAWFRAGGGAGQTAPGTATTITVALEPGTYYVVDTAEPEGENAKPYYERGGLAKFEVRGERSAAEAPAVRGRVTAKEYSFTASGLAAGKNRVEFDNAGKEPHHIVAAPIAPGKAIADVREFFRTEKGRPPVAFDKFVTTSVIDGETTETVELELQRGDYAMLCFISDRKGGPPHVAKGMISEATVE